MKIRLLRMHMSSPHITSQHWSTYQADEALRVLHTRISLEKRLQESCDRMSADLLPKHCAKKVSFPLAGSKPLRAAEYCCSASAHCRPLNAALPASLAFVMARSLFRPRTHAAESGSLRSACVPASNSGMS